MPLSFVFLRKIIEHMHLFFQAPWCLSPAQMGHTLIQTREGYKKRESVYPALQGSSAGTLDA